MKLGRIIGGCLFLLVCIYVSAKDFDKWGTSVLSDEQLQSIVDCLSKDKQLLIETKRKEYLTKLAQTEQYLYSPLHTMQMNLLEGFARDTTLENGGRERIIKDRTALYIKVVPLIIRADSLINQKIDEEAIKNVIENLKPYQSNELLTRDQLSDLQKRVTILESYKGENEKFKAVFDLDPDVLDTYTRLQKIENPASSLVIAFVQGKLIPYFEKQTAFATFKHTEVPYLKQLYEQLKKELDVILQTEDTSLEQIKIFLEHKNEL